MKKILISAIFVLVGIIGSGAQAHAFYIEDAIEFSSPQSSPYPFVLSQPIDVLPAGYITINVGDQVYYYFNGSFYQMIMRDQKYVAVPPPIGAVIFDLPIGYECMFIHGTTYYEYQGVYYRRALNGYRVIYPPV